MPRKKKSEEENKVENLKEKLDEGMSITENNKQEEFPDTDISIDIFSQHESAEKTEKKEEEKGDKKDKLRELKEKAKKLAEKLELGEEIKTEDIKEKLEKERQTLVPSEDYVKSGV